MYTIEQIEDGFVAALAPLKIGYTPVGEADPAVWRTVRTIKTYQGELDDEDSISRAIRLMPAILVVYRHSVYASHGARKMEKMTFTVFFCDKNLRQESEVRRGGTDNPGVYAMMDGSRDRLYGKQLGLEISPLEAIRQGALWFGGGISIYSADYETAQALLYP